jgi:hypothetical protein
VADVDFTGWPIVEVRLDAQPGPPDVAAIVDAIERSLERREAFGLIVVTPMLLRTIDEPAAPRLAWVRKHRAEVGTWCRGVAYVLPRLTRSVALAARADELQWGCAVVALRTTDEARGWMAARLGGDGVAGAR